jgi:hypothetical protein
MYGFISHVVTSASIIFEFVAAKVLLQYYKQRITAQYQSRLYVGLCTVHWLRDYTPCTLIFITDSHTLSLSSHYIV